MHAIDYGPAANRHRVEREARPDGPRVTVLGGRRMDGLRTMLKRGNITSDQWIAAERYRDDLARASGISDREPGGYVSGGSPGYGPSERQIDAQTRVNAIARITKPERIMVLTMVVIGGESITEMARIGGVGKERVSADLRAALDRIAEFYDDQPAESER